MACVLGGTGFLLYRSVWKGTGSCRGCKNAGCSRRGLFAAAVVLGGLIGAGASAQAANGGEPLRAALPPTPGDAEIHHAPAGNTEAGIRGRFTEKVTFSGLLETEAAVPDAGRTRVRTTAQLAFGVEADENIGGTLLLLFEDGQDPSVDEATIDISGGRWYASFGLQQLPFGRFTTSFVTSPLTLELGEIRETALAGGSSAEMFTLSFFLYGGRTKNPGDGGGIRDWGAALKLAPAKAFQFGLGYVTNLVDGVEEPCADAGTSPCRSMAGWNLHADAAFGPLGFLAEALGTVGKFATDDGRRRPFAWNIEMVWEPAPRVKAALRTESGRGCSGKTGQRYGAAASWSPQEQVSVTAEYLRISPGGVDGASLVATRLSLGF